MKKESQVTIVPNKLGAKIRVSANNSEYAHVLLKQEKTSISTSGWVQPIKVHALLQGKVEDIQNIGIADMDTLPGQIVVKEQLIPFDNNNPERDYKYAGNTGIVCCQDGQPIYRKCFFDATMLQVDTLIPHTNGLDIKIANTSDEDAKLALKAEQSFISGLKYGEQIDLEDSIAEVESEKNNEDDYDLDILQKGQDKQLKDLEQYTISPEEKEIIESPSINPFDETDDDDDIEEEDELIDEDEDDDTEDLVEINEEEEENTFQL
jgi:hypothetical protein